MYSYGRKKIFYKEGLLTEEQAERMYKEAISHHKKIDQEIVEKNIRSFLDLFRKEEF